MPAEVIQEAEWVTQTRYMSRGKSKEKCTGYMIKNNRLQLENFRPNMVTTWTFFNVDIPDEVEMLAWGMKRIVEPLKRKNVEIGGRIQHTCVMRSVLILGIDSTMSKHLELYSTISEYENARFPMTYCLLSTATVIDVWEAKINPCGGTSDVRWEGVWRRRSWPKIEKMELYLSSICCQPIFYLHASAPDSACASFSFLETNRFREPPFWKHEMHESFCSPKRNIASIQPEVQNLNLEVMMGTLI